MEFLRFGSSIPGSYWGCCAVDIIQNFNFDPADKASIELVDGDGGTPLKVNNEYAYLGPTYEDIFWQRLRIGTFSSRDMPNHTFFAVLTAYQLGSTTGKKWLAILERAGFEFLRTVDNSVYTGDSTMDKNPNTSPHPNYIFALFRNCGAGSVTDPLQPPQAWLDLRPDNATLTREEQLERYKALPPSKFYTRAELEAMEVPITLAGQRSDKPQQLASQREKVTPLKTSKENAVGTTPWAEPPVTTKAKAKA